MAESLSFLAQLAERSGLSRDQDGATLRLHIYETEIPHVIGMVALNKCVLRVTVEVVDANSIAASTHESGARKSRRSARIEKQ